MPPLDSAAAADYREAWDAWQKQIEHVHRVLLDGESARPDALKGLLNREARAKERYDAARSRLLGIDESAYPASASGENPFR
ncbi:MAG: hypothetical protein AB7T37_12460 [Dehalococcoidia bacterium]